MYDTPDTDVSTTEVLTAALAATSVTFTSPAPIPAWACRC